MNAALSVNFKKKKILKSKKKKMISKHTNCTVLDSAAVSHPSHLNFVSFFFFFPKRKSTGLET